MTIIKQAVIESFHGGEYSWALKMYPNGEKFHNNRITLILFNLLLKHDLNFNFEF